MKPEASLKSDKLSGAETNFAGECYDDKELDKHRVCEVILNRLINSKFANTILESPESTRSL